MPDITTPESNHTHLMHCMLGALNYHVLTDQVFVENVLEILVEYAKASNPGKIVYFKDKIGFVPKGIDSMVITGYVGANLMMYQSLDYEVIIKK